MCAHCQQVDRALGRHEALVAAVTLCLWAGDSSISAGGGLSPRAMTAAHSTHSEKDAIHWVP